MGAYFLTKESIYKRLRLFGEDKSKLAIFLFEQKIDDSMVQSELNQTGGSKRTKINLELTDSEEEHLDKVYNDIQSIKHGFDFVNLDNYLKSTSKNYQVLQKGSEKEQQTIEEIKKFLDLYCLSNFFKQTQNVANVNFLNHKDEVFVHKLEMIMIVR